MKVISLEQWKKHKQDSNKELEEMKNSSVAASLAKWLVESAENWGKGK